MEVPKEVSCFFGVVWKSGVVVYRFGFNGKEDDTSWGSQKIQDYGFRLYNPSIAKFLSVDPLAPEYPWYTPYQFAGNMPIQAIDIDGLEPGVTTGNTFADIVGDLIWWYNVTARNQVKEGRAKLIEGSTNSNPVINNLPPTVDQNSKDIMHKLYAQAGGQQAMIPVYETLTTVSEAIPVYGSAITLGEAYVNIEEGNPEVAALSLLLIPIDLLDGPVPSPAKAIVKNSGKAYRKGPWMDFDQFKKNLRYDDGKLSHSEFAGNPVDGDPIIFSMSSKKETPFYVVDITKLPEGTVVHDGGLSYIDPATGVEKIFPDGHISISATPEQIWDALIKPAEGKNNGKRTIGKNKVTTKDENGKEIGVNFDESGYLPKKAKTKK